MLIPRARQPGTDQHHSGAGARRVLRRGAPLGHWLLVVCEDSYRHVRACVTTKPTFSHRNFPELTRALLYVSAPGNVVAIHARNCPGSVYPGAAAAPPENQLPFTLNVKTRDATKIYRLIFGTVFSVQRCNEDQRESVLQSERSEDSRLIL